MKIFGPGDRDLFQKNGTPKKKKAVIYMYQVDEEFTVFTNDGPVAALSGDSIAYDSDTGNVWSVSPLEIEANYEDA